MSAAGVASKASELAPRAADLAERSERERRVPAELSSEIAAAGLYRMWVPEALGGGEDSPREMVQALQALAAGDASPAWCAAVCATAGMLAAYLPEDAAREVYGDPAGVVGGVFAPMGRATPDGAAYTVTGRWRFSSNVANCDWLMVGCIVFDGDEPRTVASGRPDVRLMVFPAGEAEVIDTWSVSGLRGTGSHDIALDGLEVPEERSASLITDDPLVDRPLYAFPTFGSLAIAIAAVALGIARGALDDLGELAGVKTPTMSTRKLAERANTQSGVARAEAELRAARAGLLDAVERAWEAALAGDGISVELRAGLRIAATHATEAAARIVDVAYGLGGGSAIYETSPLQRRFRDVHAATQHMLVGPSTWELGGRVLLGLELDDSQL